jgi:hypothetical protein
MWFKEYHSAAWPTLQQYVAADRWRPAGSWINAADVNVPSPESLMRQALYAKRFFRQEFNRTSQDVFLPNCFGFGFALPPPANDQIILDFNKAENPPCAFTEFATCPLPPRQNRLTISIDAGERYEKCRH